MKSAMKSLKWHSKLVLALIILLPVYFAIAAFGTNIGLWGYQFGLGAMVIVAGPWLLGLLAVAALVSLIIAALRKPRSRLALGIAIAGLVVPALIFLQFLSLRNAADDNPIHDVSTDTADPPQFSPSTMALRAEEGANPLIDYQVPLGETEMYANADPQLAIRNTAQIINREYAELSPLPLGGASRADAVAAVAAAMGNMGFENIQTDVEAGRVEGVAETFWYGFKDDVVARVGESEIDFRSVSRVGRSDLGANAERIAELRERTAQRIGQR